MPDGSTIPAGQIPAILDLPEYEELGWSLDGIATVDPSTIAVHINLTFTVLTNALTQSSPRPYNKQNALASGADYTNPVDGYIEALNYADHLIVTIPGMLTSENVTVSAMAGTIFKFYYSGPEEKDPLPLSVEFSNMAADLAGIHFTLKPSSDAESATIFNAVMDNAGTSATGEGYMLYITATPVIDGIPGAESSMTEFHVPRYYTLTGTLESYAPGHIATLTILEETEGADVAEPLTMTVEVQNEGWDLWSQDFAFRSSELADKTFTLTIDKIGNIFYTRTNIVLTTSVATNFTFTLDNGASIALIPGDINGDGLVNTTDRAYLSSVLRDPTADAAVEGSLAYRADLNGDGVVTVADSAILAANLRSSTDSYGNPTGLNWKL